MSLRHHYFSIMKGSLLFGKHPFWALAVRAAEQSHREIPPACTETQHFERPKISYQLLSPFRSSGCSLRIGMSCTLIFTSRQIFSIRFPPRDSCYPASDLFARNSCVADSMIPTSSKTSQPYWDCCDQEINVEGKRIYY